MLSRAPGVRDALGLSSAQFGLLLLCLSGGSLVGLPLSGPIVHRFGPARVVLTASLTVTTGLVTVATGVQAGVAGPAAVGFVLIGLGVGIWDVAMNVEDADVERALGRSLIPRLHAAFSLGTMAGAGVGVASAATGVPLAGQVLLVAALAAWCEPRTRLIGLLVLGFAFMEGSADDWIAVAMVDGYGRSEALGAIGFGVFVSAMTRPVRCTAAHGQLHDPGRGHRGAGSRRMSTYSTTRCGPMRRQPATMTRRMPATIMT